MEERVQRLEEDNYFLSRRVRQLDEALTLQQLARMSAEVERLKEIASEGTAPMNTPPPHYNSW